MIPPSPSERFPAALRALRKERRLSQEQLAERAGLHRNAISFLERGINKPTIDTMEQLASALEISFMALCERFAGAISDKSA